MDMMQILLYGILEINLNKKRDYEKKNGGLGAEEMIQQLGVLSKPQRGLEFRAYHPGIWSMPVTPVLRGLEMEEAPAFAGFQPRKCEPQAQGETLPVHV